MLTKPVHSKVLGDEPQIVQLESFLLDVTYGQQIVPLEI